MFNSNNATISGGGLHSSSSSITITGTCEFHTNSATISGGVLDFYSSTIAIEASKFYDNHTNSGGVLSSLNTIVKMDTTEFRTNSGTYGGREGPFQTSNFSICISELVISKFAFLKLSFQNLYLNLYFSQQSDYCV